MTGLPCFTILSLPFLCLFLVAFIAVTISLNKITDLDARKKQVRVLITLALASGLVVFKLALDHHFLSYMPIFRSALLLGLLFCIIK